VIYAIFSPKQRSEKALKAIACRNSCQHNQFPPK
jgi:hypothetical protein